MILRTLPYVLFFYFVEKGSWLYRHCRGNTAVEKAIIMMMNFQYAFRCYAAFYRLSRLQICVKLKSHYSNCWQFVRAVFYSTFFYAVSKRILREYPTPY